MIFKNIMMFEKVDIELEINIEIEIEMDIEIDMAIPPSADTHTEIYSQGNAIYESGDTAATDTHNHRHRPLAGLG